MFSYVSRALCAGFGGLRALWPLGSNMPCFGHLGTRKHRTCHALATQALKGAARGPARCPRGARMGRSSPHLVPPKRSQGLHHPPLDAPRALEGAARAPAQCPEGALRGCASLLGAPGGSKWVLKPLLGTPRAFRVPFRPPAWCCRGTLELPPVSPDAR